MILINTDVLKQGFGLFLHHSRASILGCHHALAVKNPAWVEAARWDTGVNSHPMSKAQILAESSQSFILMQPTSPSVHPGCTETTQSSSGDAVLGGFPKTGNAGRAMAKPYLAGKEMPNDFDDDLLVLVRGLVSRHNDFCAR